MNFFKPTCPNCKKKFWNQIIQTEDVKIFKFSKTLQFCPNCHIEIKETKKKCAIPTFYCWHTDIVTDNHIFL